MSDIQRFLRVAKKRYAKTQMCRRSILMPKTDVDAFSKQAKADSTSVNLLLTIFANAYVAHDHRILSLIEEWKRDNVRKSKEIKRPTFKKQELDNIYAAINSDKINDD